MGLFDFMSAKRDVFDERDKLRAGMNKPIDDWERQSDKFLDDAERLSDLETNRGFMKAVGDNMLNNAKYNLGFGGKGPQTDSERKMPKLPEPIPIPKAGSLLQRGPMTDQSALMAAQMPQIGMSPAMQQIMQAQQMQQMYGQANPYQTGGMMPMMQTPSPMGALNVQQGPQTDKDALLRLIMGR